MKSLENYLPVYFLVALSVGIVTGFYFEIPIKVHWWSLMVVSLLCIFTFFLSKNFTSYFFTLSVLLWFAVWGSFIISSKLPFAQTQHFSHFITENTVTAFTIDERLKPNPYYNRYKINILLVNQHKVVGKSLLYVAKNKDVLPYNQVYVAPLNFRKPNTVLNPFQFNYREYLRKQNIVYQSFIHKDNKLMMVETQLSIKGKMMQWRDQLSATIDRYDFGENEKAILKALILGDKFDLSDEVVKSYSNIGAVHILAISGLHIGILYGILMWIFGLIKNTKPTKMLKTLLVIMLLWSYALLVGMSGSVVRAVTMFSFIAVAQSFTGQKIQVIHTLIVSCLLLLLIYPFYLFDVGFQLSYSAVLGIILFYPLIIQSIAYSKNKVVNYVWGLLSLSLAATLGTFSLTLYYFHQFPLLFAVSNIFIVPLSGLVLMGGIIFLVLAIVVDLPNFTIVPLDISIKLMNGIASLLSKFDETLLRNIHFPIGYVPFVFLIIFKIYAFWIQKNYLTFRKLLWSILIFQLVVFILNIKLLKQRELVIFYQKNFTQFAFREGQHVQLFTEKNDSLSDNNQSLQSYFTGNGIKSVDKFSLQHNYFKIHGRTWYLVDSLGIYNAIPQQPDVILLTHSPKIHFEKMIVELHPSLLIADGTNHKHLIKYWKNTANKSQIPFYSISEQGAYIEKWK